MQKRPPGLRPTKVKVSAEGDLTSEYESNGEEEDENREEDNVQ